MLQRETQQTGGTRKPLPPVIRQKDWQNWPMVEYLDIFNFPIKAWMYRIITLMTG